MRLITLAGERREWRRQQEKFPRTDGYVSLSASERAEGGSLAEGSVGTLEQTVDALFEVAQQLRLGVHFRCLFVENCGII